MKKYRIATIPSEGIGNEVVPPGILVLDAAARKHGFPLSWNHFPRNCSCIDFHVVRENNEGEYTETGGRLYVGSDDEIAMQQVVFTRRGVDRILRYAFEAVVKAIEFVVEHGPRTRDLGGAASTVEVGRAIADAVANRL